MRLSTTEKLLHLFPTVARRVLQRIQRRDTIVLRPDCPTCLADDRRRFRQMIVLFIAIPTHVCPSKNLFVSTIHARDETFALIGRQILALDPAKILHGWRTRSDGLGAADRAIRAGALFGELQRVTFGAGA